MDDSASSTSRTNGSGGGAGSSAHETLAARIAAGCRIDAEVHHHQQQGRPAPSSSSSQPPPSALVPSSAGPGPSAQLRKKVVWECTHCEKACFPIRFESRCLCNHRYRQHPAAGDFACAEKGCKCQGFFYIFAEGAFMLRCRCKHKAAEHDAGAAPYACARAGCKCTAFDSPWVCNCDHPWADHTQRTVEVDIHAPLAASVAASNEFQVRRTDISVPLPRYGGSGGSTAPR